MDGNEQKIASTTTRVCAFLSIFGCGYIMYEVLSNPQKRQGIYFRLMCCMSFVEFCDALAYFVGSWATGDEDWWGSAGNHTSCMVQAFFFQASIGSSLYNASLAIYYVFSIRYNWSERILSRKLELWMHCIALLVGYGTATASYFLGIYGSLGPICYIIPHPPDCKETYKYGYTDCLYGDNATLYQFLFYETFLWISIFVAAVCMCLIWYTVRHQENRNARYSQPFQNTGTSNSSSRSRRRIVDRTYSKRFAVQGALYVFVFYLANLFTTVAYILHSVTGQWNQPIFVIGGFFNPLEGFLNFLVYMRPKWIRYRKERQQQRREGEAEEAGADTPSGNATNNGSGIGTGYDTSDGNDGIAYLRQEEEEQIGLDAY